MFLLLGNASYSACVTNTFSKNSLLHLTPVLVLFSTCHTEPAFSGLNGAVLLIVVHVIQIPVPAEYVVSVALITQLFICMLVHAVNAHCFQFHESIIACVTNRFVLPCVMSSVVLTVMSK